MGLAIDREHFDEADHARFAARLDRSLAALDELLSRPGFGEGASTIGAEVEMSLVGSGGRPVPVNERVIAAADDPRLTVELNRFNLECNLRPAALAGTPFAALEREIAEVLDLIAGVAAGHGARPALIGILPTLGEADLGGEWMTDDLRYRALAHAIMARRQTPPELRIEGEESLATTCHEITYEGAATSLQVHLRVSPRDFTDAYNAAQLAAGPALALAANSPILLGRRLWHETRIALFTQAVDDRPRGDLDGMPRVSFGSGWLTEGALELFAENVVAHAPLLPVLDESLAEDPLEHARRGGVPRLLELRLHQGTVWRWNRAIFDPVDEDPHLRIEMRAFPAGPTAIDMVANAAFHIGLTRALAPVVGEWVARVPFDLAAGNFDRAARAGADAVLAWPGGRRAAARRTSTRDLAPALVERAREGLADAGVDANEADRLMGIIDERAASGRTGAAWQLAALAALESRLGRADALAAMLERYLANSATGEPVHLWPLPR